MRHHCAIVFTALILFSGSAQAQSGRIPVAADSGMVVSSHYLASEAGMEVLRSGGNAVDAAIATAFALAVTLPSAGNIGGGGFLVYHGADGYVTTFNFREKAPLAATETMFLGPDGEIIDNSNHEGPLSVGVPGTVSGLWLAHQRLGTLDWATLVEPAVQLAAEGFPSTRAMQWFLKQLAQRSNPLYAATRHAFLKDGTDVFRPGEIWRQPDLAASLARIRDHGHDGFYQGETARLLSEFMARHGGLITMEDLALYEAEELPPVHGSFGEYDIYSMSPPSSGGVALITMLNILEAYDLTSLGHNSAQYLHLLTEAMRRAFADRAEHLGDPNFNPNMPVERLISKAHADQLRATINEERASQSDPEQLSQLYLSMESEETTHLSVVDAVGNAVSLTYTLEHSYGSQIVADGTGFLLNNEMGDFNPVPGNTNLSGRIGTPPNLVAPQKRMLSSMTPAIVAKGGKPFIVVGSPGGRTIINTVLQVILNVTTFEMDIAQAVEAARIHHQWLPNITSFESWGISPDTQALYEAKGHLVRYRSSQGRAHCIMIQGGTLYGAADSRSYDGQAIGF
ncbi:MAG: gamma-glutamyltransferase [Rhodothermaceae bacterium]|nr:gamma-glutamyltransferase [Rhodothermaceae bacterium]MXW33871.1 gamma-glutamyltransferase [Rhodothermaceae bacterium]MYC04801.1 gamma-glutamyltransferase [Rhodothermaceae bacterium]MYE62690.1 gamma-glutamyltransferase [Rhodothermaceae bacterium]MYI18167.1 gamma-glutamyltransferase [Rhodothermaceae bacterium]